MAGNIKFRAEDAQQFRGRCVKPVNTYVNTHTHTNTYREGERGRFDFSFTLNTAWTTGFLRKYSQRINCNCFSIPNINSHTHTIYSEQNVLRSASICVASQIHLNTSFVFLEFNSRIPIWRVFFSD